MLTSYALLSMKGDIEKHIQQQFEKVGTFAEQIGKIVSIHFINLAGNLEIHTIEINANGKLHLTFATIDSLISTLNPPTPLVISIFINKIGQCDYEIEI